MKSGPKMVVWAVILLGVIAGAGWLFFGPFNDQPGQGKGGRAQQPVPVEVARIEHGPIAFKRTFSGELEALAEFVVAPKVNGRVERVLVNIADTVRRGQVVAELELPVAEGEEIIFTWYGLNSVGKQAGSGIYFAVLDADTELNARKFTLIR